MKGPVHQPATRFDSPLEEAKMCDCGCESGTCNCSGESCGCNCHQGGGFHRRYQTKAERKAELESYLAELKAEVQAVEEMLADL
jgi:hypothetical protein